MPNGTCFDHRGSLGSTAFGLALLCAIVTAKAEPSQELIAAAKKEGTVTWYTNLIVEQIVRPLGAAFEKKYGIKMAYWRGDGAELNLKLLGEARARRVQGDIYSIGIGVDSLIKAGVTEPYDPVNAKGFPAEYKDPAHHWIASNIYINTPGYNTSLVQKSEAPRTYEALLDPKWKGKMAWKRNDISGAQGFIGNILSSMGEEKGIAYLRRLSEQNIISVNASARAILDQVMAGEYPIALQIFNNHAEISAKKGAPVDWLPMEPVTVSLNIIGLLRGGPSPNAGKLLIEFMLSKEGQQVFRERDYYPADPEVPAKIPDLLPATGGFKGNVMSPAMIANGLDRWTRLYDELFK